MIKNLILLCGNNRDNLPWLEEIGANLSDKYCVYVHKYQHWENGGNINFDTELDALKKHVTGLDDYAIIAKSAGGLLALMGYKQGIFNDAIKIIIIGTPIEWAKERNIDYTSLICNDGKVRYIQATNDPKGKYSELVKLVGDDAKVREYPSDNHHYGEIEVICGDIKSFLERVPKKLGI